MGIERFFDSLESTLIVGSSVSVFIAPLSGQFANEALKMASKLRAMGLGVEMDLMQRNMKKNIEYSAKKGIPFIIFAVENEAKALIMKAREIASGNEREFGPDDAKGIADFIRKP